MIACALEYAFYHDARLDPSEWEALAAEIESSERPHRAEATRLKLRRLQSLVIFAF